MIIPPPTTKALPKPMTQLREMRMRKFEVSDIQYKGAEGREKGVMTEG